MQPCKFPEHNAVLAENQPEYLPLPVYRNGRETISCWVLTWRERWQLLFGGKLWLRQLTFGELLQPQLPSVETPFVGVVETTPGRYRRVLSLWRKLTLWKFAP